MKTLKKIMAFALIAAMLFSFAACGNTGKYKIGVCQFAAFDALDDATRGFKDAVVEALGEENVTFFEQNAQGDMTVCGTIINDFVSRNVDLIMANATPAVQQAYNATTKIPILGTSVTEYGVAMNIPNFNGVTGINVSGTSDLAPLDTQAQMILDWVPTAKKVGLLYCSAEANSLYQVGVVKAYLESKGVTCTEYKFSDSNDVAQITEKAAADSDVIYVPTDNTAASCAQTIRNIVLEKKIPVIAGEGSICKAFGVATLSISYYELGRVTGEMAVKVLKGEAKIEEMAIGYDTNPVLVYNPEVCDALGIPAIPAGYKAID